MKTNDATTIREACGHDCPNTCSMMVEVCVGQAGKRYGNSEHPFALGTFYAKVDL